MLAGGGLRALAGLALASSNGDEWRQYAGARAGKFLLQAGPRTAVLRDRAWGGGCFWPTLSPGRSVGQQRPPWASCNPHRQAKATPKQNSKHRRCHLHPHREQLPIECLSGGSAFWGGKLCVSRLYPPIIYHLLSAKKQPRANTIFLAGGKAQLQNEACFSPAGRHGGRLHGLERAKQPNASLTKETVRKTQP